LLGLKENVILGKLIPAGTGMSRYRNIQTRITPDALPEWWLIRQQELREAREASEEGDEFGLIGVRSGPAAASAEPPVGMTREEAEKALGGVGAEEI
jgi:hypothetical protein